MYKNFKQGTAFRVDSINIDLDNNQKTIMLSHNTYGSKVEYKLDPQFLVPEALLRLSSYGFDIRHDNQRESFHYIRNLMSVAPKKYSHSHLGFSKLNGKDVFKFNSIILADKALGSKYVGDVLLESRGSIDDWIAGVKNLIIGSIGLELSLAIAGAAVLNGYIGDEISMDTTMFHFSGNSSVGKTTAARCAISFCSAPVIKEGSLLSSFVGTSNSILRRMANNFGVIKGFDDSSGATIKDRVNFVYKLSSSVEKGRLNGDLQQCETPTWKTMVLANGEQNFLSQEDYIGGTRVRLIEIPNIVLTRDAQHAHDLNDFLNKCYGTAIEPYVQAVMKCGKENIRKRYNAQYKKIIKKISTDNFGERKAKIFALVILSAFIFNKTFDLGINTKKLRKYLIELHNATAKADNVAQQAFESLKDMVTINSSKFFLSDFYDRAYKYKRNFSETLGKFCIKSKYKEISVISSKCSEYLKKQGYKNINNIYSTWKDNGWIITDKGCTTKKVTICTGLRVRCIVFRIKIKKVKKDPFDNVE